MERYRPSATNAPPNSGGETVEPKPNGRGGDPINDAPEITPEYAKIAEALTAFSTEAAQLGRARFEAIGHWVWVASDGSDEGRALFDEWSKPWLYYSDDNARRHWDYCAKYPPQGVDADTLFKEAAKVRDRDQKLKDAAQLDKIAYEQIRKDLAKDLGVRKSVLDAEVERYRGPGEDSPLFPHWKVTPAADKVDTGPLLADIKAQIERYVATLGPRAIVPAVFTMFTWLHEGSTHSPQLVATSPEADSGKTTLTGVMKFLTRRSIATVGITGAVLFRSIEKWNPTLIIDEADTVLAENDDLRTVVNSGWTCGESVLRCDETPSRDPRPYSTFAAKVLAMKKHRGRVRLPDTTLSRSIIIELKRKTAAERVDDFDHLDCEEFMQLRSRLARWAADNADLHKAKPEKLEGFDNRLWQNWRLLLAIAERAGARDELVAAVKEVEGTKSLDDRALGEALLADIRTIFDAEFAEETEADPGRKTGEDKLLSRDLVGKLTADETKLWAEYYKGKPITQKQMAGLLRAHLIFPRTVHLSKTLSGKGYERKQFEDAWNRYIPADPHSDPSVRPTEAESMAYDDFDPSEAAGADGSEPPDKPLKTHASDGRTDRDPPRGEKRKPRFRTNGQERLVWRDGKLRRERLVWRNGQRSAGGSS